MLRLGARSREALIQGIGPHKQQATPHIFLRGRMEMTQGTSTMMATATASSTSTNEAQASSNQALAPKGLAQHKTPILESRTPLMMQLIVHRALLTDPGSTWTTGPMMAQAAHAATAVTVKTLSTSALTQEYFSEKNLTYMRKVVLQTPSKGALADLAALSAKLTEGRREWMQRRQSQDDTSGDDEFPDHHLWIEQPESVPTCLAIAPNRKPAALRKILNKCSLLRD